MATPSPSPHKPRRRLKKVANGETISKTEALVRSPAFPLSAFLWPARGSVSQWESLALILMIVGVFRWAAGLWGYSGTGHLILRLGPFPCNLALSNPDAVP